MFLIDEYHSKFKNVLGDELQIMSEFFTRFSCLYYCVGIQSSTGV